MTAELRLFGGAALIDPEGRPIAGTAAQPRRIAVLAVLADAWPSPVTRDRLVGLIWPENDDAGARRLLTQALYALRRELGDFTHVSGRDVAIDAEALRVDLIEFRQALAAGDLDRAVGLHRGLVLDGFHLRGAAEFERWTDALRDATQRQLREAVEGAVRRHERAGQPREAARWVERLVQASPFDAGAVLQLMTLWEQAGDLNAALWAEARYTRRIREELDLEPAPAVQLRAEELRGHAAAAAAAAEARLREAARRPVVPDERAGTRAAPPPALVPDELPAAAPTVLSPVSSASPSPAMATSAPIPTPAHGRAAGTRARWMWGAVLAAGIAGVLLVGGSRQARPASGATARGTVAVLPFRLRGDSAGADRAASVTRSVLLTALDGSGGMRLREANDSGAAREARDEGWGLLQGTVAVVGGELQLEARLQPVAGDAPELRASVRGPRDSVIALAERLSLQLAPALYPQLAGVVPDVVLQRFRRPAPLREYLDGEAAFRRGAFVDAYEAFRLATETDSTQAYAWYRRAVAAELAHRNPEADQSLGQARLRAGSLTERERRLLDGYARWRAGDAIGAEAVFRELIAGQIPDREAWYHFAEIAYHAGPLLGHPVDAALDPWRRVVALDSGNVPGVMHLIRLEARAGDSATASALVRRVAAGEDEVEAAESRVVAAYGSGDASRIAAVQPLLDTLPDYSLHFLHATVAGLLERPELARGIAARLTRAGRPDAMRAEGHLALAHVDMAEGRWRAAWAELDSAARLNPAAAAWTRAWFAALPWMSLPDSVRADAARRLAGTSAVPAAAPLYLQLAVEAPAGPAIEAYLGALLGDRAAAARLARACPDSASAATRALCADLRGGAAADEAMRTGQNARALAELEALGMVVPYQFAGRSVFFARTRERWLRAELLGAAGREAEALGWYASVSFPSRYDYVFLAPAHLARARILEKEGDRAAAAAQYRKVIELWRQPDAELAGIRREADEGLRRLTGGR